ncbi:MAG: 3D domain-containing protein [Gemmatimonadota bacterium]|nr:3D domain-containing protein [Gemmatimonadota bacterium]
MIVERRDTSKWRVSRALLGVVLGTALMAVPVPAAATEGEGVVIPFGAAISYGEVGQGAAFPVTGMESTPTGGGYWLVATDGGVFTYGDADFHGSTGAMALNQPIVDMESTPDGTGYWFAASDGGVFTFGSALFLGAMGATPLNSPVVGMAASPTGRGYWLVAADGGVFSFGDAEFLGSMGGSPLNSPVTAIAATPSGNGYWLVAADGGVFSFGDAGYYGSMAGIALNGGVVSIASNPSGSGYWMAGEDGGVFAFGDALSFGSTTTQAPVVDLAALPQGGGYWLATGRVPDPLAALAYMGEFLVTCYSLQGYTATGELVHEGGVAVDPQVIPYGTSIYIVDVGWRVANDTGGSIDGNRLDIWKSSYSECISFGQQTLSVLK